MTPTTSLIESAETVTRFDPNARDYEAYSIGARTDAKGRLAATNLDAAQAEATERWHWDRGDRLGIRERGQEDSPFWPFEKQAFDRLHIYATQRSKPLGWVLSKDLCRTVPVYRYSLKLLCTLDVGALSGAGFQWERSLKTIPREPGMVNSPGSDDGN